MYKIIVGAITPIIIFMVAPFGVNEATPFGEAIVMILLGLGGLATSLWLKNKAK